MNMSVKLIIDIFVDRYMIKSSFKMIYIIG